MKQYTATPVVGSPVAQLGEGPLWDHRTQCLYWIDIVGKALHWRMADGSMHIQNVGKMIGFITLTSNPAKLIAGLEDGIVVLTVGAQVDRYLVRPEGSASPNRFNDGKTDPYGRIYAGTMPLSGGKPSGAFYRIDKDGSAQKLFSEVACSNGLAFSNDYSTLYYIDTPTRTIDALDYDKASGAVSNRRCAIDMSNHKGMPDGMCIDTEGQLWVGLWGGHGVARFDPATKEQTGFISVLAANVTCCAFGGPDLRTLYITTNQSAPAEYPLSGQLFSVTPGVAGHPSTPFPITE